MFMLYGISELPEIIIQAKGKPAFRDKNLPVFLSPTPEIWLAWR